MIWVWEGLAVTLAGLAGWIGCRVPGTRRIEPGRDKDGEPSPAFTTLVRRLLLAAAATGTVVAAYVLGGPRPTVVVLAVLVAVLAVTGQIRAQRDRRQWLRRREAAARACAALAAQLRVGRLPADAVRVCAADHPILARGAQALSVGADPAAGWARQGQQPGDEGLGVLAQGWAVATRTGTSLAATLERVADVVDQEQRLQRVVAGEVAAPRATGKIMAALPAAGLALGFALGGNPLQFLVDHPAGWVCLVGGVTLAATGVAWIERLARRAERG